MYTLKYEHYALWEITPVNMYIIYTVVWEVTQPCLLSCDAVTDEFYINK